MSSKSQKFSADGAEKRTLPPKHPIPMGVFRWGAGAAPNLPRRVGGCRIDYKRFSCCNATASTALRHARRRAQRIC